MTHQEILEKAIRKAKSNGWKGIENIWHQTNVSSDWRLIEDPMTASAYDVIFNHDFAKALWGDGLVGNKIPFGPELGAFGISRKNTCAYQYHLQQMAIAEDPIAYLGTYL